MTEYIVVFFNIFNTLEINDRLRENISLFGLTSTPLPCRRNLTFTVISM